MNVPAVFTPVKGQKKTPKVSQKKKRFLEAANVIITELKPYWPLSVRQVHYQLLNNPPLTSEPKSSKFDPERYRYKNDKKSYKALVELLSQARYSGELDAESIDDATRPRYARVGFKSVSHFMEYEIKHFMQGYHRSPQLDQPRHIEVLGEKNTLLQILKPVCEELYTPLTIARGYGSFPIWRDMAYRFSRSGKKAFSLIVASDYDPEGLDLANDAIRSLRLFGVDAKYSRIAVNRAQIDKLNLVDDFNPAKKTSTRFKQFVRETGGTSTWEIEALPPDYLQQELRDRIEQNMDMRTFRDSQRALQDSQKEIAELRQEIANDMGI